jgi:hypothetical protein
MVASNHCTQAEWSLAQFIGQLPYSFTVTMILTLSFHFMTGINDSTEVFVWMFLNLWLLVRPHCFIQCTIFTDAIFDFN